MNVQIQIDSICKEPRVVIYCDEVTDEVRAVVNRINASAPGYITGFSGSNAQIMDPTEITRIGTEGGKVYAYTSAGKYRLRMRLYQAEALLSSSSFVRISQSELINMQQVHHFDLSMSGVIRVVFQDGSATFVARRYLDSIRSMLGINGRK